MVEFALFLRPVPDRMWALGRQMGVGQAVTSLPTVGGSRGTGGEQPWDFGPLLQVQQEFKNVGYEIAVMESSPPMHKAKHGLPGRDEEIEWFQTMLRNLGRLGVPVVCWNWMAGLGWQRTSLSDPGRGGALVTSYTHALNDNAPDLPDLQTEEQLWDNLAYFLKAVVPVAEEAGVKLAMHPDDPPLTPLRGMARIMRTPENFDRLLDIVPSPYNGVTYCQANFHLMPTDHDKWVRHFAGRGALHFVHFRAVRGDVYRFSETFHDEGTMDMLAMMRLYHSVGFSGVMRPDHAPTMAEEPNDHPGYERLGRIFAVGYMAGLREAVRAEQSGQGAG